MFFVGSYWPARQEAAAAVSSRLERFLTGIAAIDPAAQGWLPKGISPKGKAAVLNTTATELAKLLTSQRSDVGGTPMPRLGLRFSAWSRSGYSLSCTLGAYDDAVTNSVVLSQTRPGPVPLPMVRRLLEASVDAFGPAHAVATSHDILSRAPTLHPWSAGWFVYHEGGAICPGPLPPDPDSGQRP